MIQLKILSGKKAGTETVTRHFPFQVGRATSCGLSLDEPGVWEKHFQIDINSSEGFLLSTEQKTSVVIDGKSVQETVLRNGDTIEIGLTKILFGLSPTHQKSLVAREMLTWVALAALSLGQVALIYQLVH
jgi:pSer/pThr/pTyr-binding forkhead associated (FHA) protein